MPDSINLVLPMPDGNIAVAINAAVLTPAEATQLRDALDKFLRPALVVASALPTAARNGG